MLPSDSNADLIANLVYGDANPVIGRQSADGLQKNATPARRQYEGSDMSPRVIRVPSSPSSPIRIGKSNADQHVSDHSENPLLVPESDGLSHAIVAHQRARAGAQHTLHALGPGSMAFGHKLNRMKQGKTLNAISSRINNANLKSQQSGSSLASHSLLKRTATGQSGSLSQHSANESVDAAGVFNPKDDFFDEREEQLELAVAYENEVFINTILAESVEIDSTRLGVDPPRCECGTVCTLRAPTELPGFAKTDTSDSYFWFCACATCTFWQPLAGAEAWAAAMGVDDEGNATGSNDLDPVLLDMSQSQGDIDDAEKQLAAQDKQIADTWKDLTESMVKPDAVALKLLVGTAIPPKCACGIPCDVIVCAVTADLYWACSTKKCLTVNRFSKIGEINDMDIGQVLKLGEALKKNIKIDLQTLKFILETKF